MEENTISDETGKLIAQRYQVRKELGGGSFGKVYEVEEKKTGTIYALKKFHRKGESGHSFPPEEVAYQEAVNLVRLGDPGCQRVVKIIDFRGYPEHDPQFFYLLMERIEGESLERVLRQQVRLSYEESIRILLGVLEGLAYMHGKGFVHCDLNPRNIVLRGGEPVLVDFNLSVHLFHTGYLEPVPGMRRYMPDESLADQPSISRATDVYSAGVLFHKMITGDFPSHLSARRRQILEEFEVPDGVIETVEKALAPLPHRYSKATPMLEDLRTYCFPKRREHSRRDLDRLQHELHAWFRSLLPSQDNGLRYVAALSLGLLHRAEQTEGEDQFNRKARSRSWRGLGRVHRLARGLIYYDDSSVDQFPLTEDLRPGDLLALGFARRGIHGWSTSTSRVEKRLWHLVETEPKSSLRADALLAIGLLYNGHGCDRVEKALVPHLQANDPRIRQRAAWAIALLYQGYFRSVWKDEMSDVERVDQAWLWGLLDHRRAWWVEFLLGMLNEDEPSIVRQAAAVALGLSAHGHGKSIEAARKRLEALANQDRDPKLAANAALGLGLIFQGAGPSGLAIRKTGCHLAESKPQTLAALWLLGKSQDASMGGISIYLSQCDEFFLLPFLHRHPFRATRSHSDLPPGGVFDPFFVSKRDHLEELYDLFLLTLAQRSVAPGREDEVLHQVSTALDAFAELGLESCEGSLFRCLEHILKDPVEDCRAAIMEHSREWTQHPFWEDMGTILSLVGAEPGWLPRVCEELRAKNRFIIPLFRGVVEQASEQVASS